MNLCGFKVGLDQPFFLIAGPCVVESEQLQLDTAGTLKEMTQALGSPFIFKSSYDKANRSSGKTFRGPGMENGLRILGEVKRQIGVPAFARRPRRLRHEEFPQSNARRLTPARRSDASLRPKCANRFPYRGREKFYR